MTYDDYLREQAVQYRELADKAEDPLVQQEFLDLATVCEEVADRIEDRMTGG
jgi:dihydroneopterin aldolase